MAESLKPRFAVDLDEIERQLAGAQAAAAHAQAPARNDPLSELARIVGQDDPFQSILASDRAPRGAGQPAGLDDLFVHRDERGPRQPAQEPRGSYSPEPPADLDAYEEQSQSYRGYRPEAEGDDYARGAYDDGDYGDPEGEEQDRVPPRNYPKRTSRKTLLTVGAVVGAAALGVGAALMVKGPSGMLSGGEPPLVKATNEPAKVQPQSPGGVEFPNQNKQIYERAGQEAQTRIVDREEQPVDVHQATRAASAEPTGAMPGQGPVGAGLSLGEPRKVRTISIRPDGTVILPDAKPAAPAPAAMAMPAPAPARTPAPQGAVTAYAETPQARPAATTPTTPARPAAATPATSGGASPQSAAPASQPAPQRVASAQPVPLAAAPQP
ncbi:MAG TPA: hypothetical protein VHG30_17825, partial [Microvirga sp.]|nr:hypothetical protein [Microvirga sp.]